MKEIGIACLKRVAILAAPGGMLVYCLIRAFGGGGTVLAPLPWLLFAAAMMIVVCMVLAFPVADWLGERAAAFYFSTASEPPPANYKLADQYENEMKWQRAFNEFQKIIEYHPQEFAAHSGRLRVVIRGCADPALARRLFHRSQRCLRDPAQRTALGAIWQELHNERAATELIA